MARRILNQHTGDANHFGTIDGIDQINQLLTGVDQSSTDPVDINTNFVIADTKLQIAHPSYSPPSTNAFFYTFTTGSLGTSRTITIPALSNLSSDTLCMIAHPQTMTGKRIDVPSGSGGTIASVLGNDLFLYPTSYVRYGANIGASNTAGHGFLNGVLTGTGTASFQLSATEGKFTRMSTGTASGSGAGTRGSAGSGIIRALSPRFYCKFRLNDTASNERFYVGWQSSNSAFPTSGDDPLTGLSGLLFGVRAADTTWQILYNEGTSGTNFANASGSPARDTNIHTIELKGDDANSKWQYSFDGSAFVDVTGAEIPASTTILFPLVWSQNAVGTPAKSFDQWHWFVQCTEPSIG